MFGYKKLQTEKSKEEALPCRLLRYPGAYRWLT